jgi:DNA-binding beta-propeller fold protein YncE
VTTSVHSQSVSLSFVSSWGSTGNPDELLSEPRRIAVDGNQSVYVYDFGGKIVRFSTQGEYIEHWGDSGIGLWRLGWVRGIEVNSASEVVVLDPSYLKIFDLSLPKPGRYLPARYNDRFGEYYGLAIAPGDSLYVCLDSSVYVRWEDGTLFRSWDNADAGDATLVDAAGVELDGLGHVFVVDAGANRIVKFDTAGHFVLAWGSDGDLPGQFNRPTDIAIGPDHNVYVTDGANHRIQVFDLEGRHLLSFGSEGSDPAEFSFPTGIAIDSDGFVYVADSHNGRIQKLASSPTSVQGSTWTSLKSRYRR